MPRMANAGLAPLAWAAGFVALAVLLAVGVLVFRSGAQRDVLDARRGRCEKGDAKSCDVLRNECIHRNGDACEALADALLASESKADARDALRLLSEACALRNRRACVRAGRKLLEGNGIEKNPEEAFRLLDRGCQLGEHEACALEPRGADGAVKRP